VCEMLCWLDSKWGGDGLICCGVLELEEEGKGKGKLYERWEEGGGYEFWYEMSERRREQRMVWGRRDDKGENESE
jgi:hypothetical protein